MRSSLVFACGLAVALVIGAPAPARADDAVTEAYRLYLSADFEGALAAFDAAETGVLSRTDVLRILEGRAQIHFALGDAEAVRGDLARLASLSPDYRLSPETPPDLVDAFSEVVGRTPVLRVEAHATRVDGDVRIAPTIVGDVGGQVRQLRVSARPEGGAWMRVADEPLVIEVDADRAVEFYVEALGVGAAVLVTEGTEARPRRLTGDASGLGGGQDDSAGLPAWAWVTLGVSAAVVAAVVVAVAVAAGGDGSTQPEAPVLP